MDSWLKDLVEKTNRILYSQWAALGANVAAEPIKRTVVDPEALLVATCAFGRYDARLFDEAMDWTKSNSGLLKPWRLKRICGEFGPDTTRCLAAVLDFIAVDERRPQFPGIIEQARRKLGNVAEEELFFNEGMLFELGKRAPEPIFLSWKLLRGKPRIRGHSGSPDMSNPSNLMVRMRRYFGTGTKGDVVTYLVTGNSGSSNGIASKTKYNQKSVYDALEELVQAGMVFKRGNGPRNALYWADAEAIARSLQLQGKRPVFIVWADVLRALHIVADDMWRNSNSWSSPFFSAEHSKELIVAVAKLVRNGGEPLEQIPLPAIGEMQGAEYNKELREFVDRTFRILVER